MKERNIITEFNTLPLSQKLIGVLFFFCILWVVGNSVFSMVNQQLTKTMTVGAEVTDIVYSDYGFIQAEESLITAESSGQVDIVVEEGKRVPKNHEVFSITTTYDEGSSKTKPYYAPISGIVSYYIDGYENMSDIDAIKDLDFRSIYEETFNSEGNNRANGDAVAGEVYAKVIDNLKTTYIYMSYSPEDNKIFNETGDVVRIRFPELNESTTGTVEEIIENGAGHEFCKIALGPVSEKFLTNRVVQAELYQVQTATLDLDRSALVMNDGEVGVYIVSNGKVQWQSVSVLEVNGDRVECETLPEGTIVVLTPQRVSPGDVVKGS